MKSNKIKVLSSLLCLAVLSLTCIGCNKTQEQPDVVEETQVPQVSVLSEISVKWMDSDRTYTVGDQVITDEHGRMTQITKRYDTVNLEYNSDGAIVNMACTDNDDGTVSLTSYTYENGLPVASVYEPNDGFRSSRDTTIQTTLDENGRVTEYMEDITYTDAEDGSISTGKEECYYTYDENGRACSMDYYTKGKLDHTTTVTYDKDGNVLSYVSAGDSLGEYLRIEFKYKTVDADTVELLETDPFILLNNLNILVEVLL